jgi:hypothetical protein
MATSAFFPFSILEIKAIFFHSREFLQIRETVQSPQYQALYNPGTALDSLRHQTASGIWSTQQNSSNFYEAD